MAGRGRGKFWEDSDDEAQAGPEATKREGEDSASGPEEEPAKPAKPPPPRPPIKRRDWADQESSSDDDDGKRVVLAGHEKLMLQAASTETRIRDHIRRREIAELKPDFSELQKVCRGWQQLKGEDAEFPAACVACAARLQAFLTDLKSGVAKTGAKKLSTKQAKVTNIILAKLKKESLVTQNDIKVWLTMHPDEVLYTPEDEEEVDAAAETEQRMESEASESSSESAEESEESESSSSSSESEDESSSSKGSSSGSSSSSEESMSLSSASSEEEDYMDYDDKHEKARAKWGVKDATEMTPTITKKTKDVGAPAKAGKKEKDVREGTPEEKKDAVSTFMEEILANPSEDLIIRKTDELFASRTKRGADRSQVEAILERLVQEAGGWSPSCKFYVERQLMTSLLDSQYGAFSMITGPTWQKTLSILTSCVVTARRKPSNLIHEQLEAAPEAVATIIVSFVSRLDDELTKALQFSDVLTAEYKERLLHTVDMLVLLWLAYDLVSQHDALSSKRQLAQRICEHIYYRTKEFGARTWEVVRRKVTEEFPDFTVPKSDTNELFIDLVSENISITRTEILAADNANLVESQGRALLHRAYHACIHNRHSEAKMLLQLSNIQEVALGLALSLQLLYNRTVVQFGLCSFRVGLLGDSYHALEQFVNVGRARELLAQGSGGGKIGEKTAEVEVAEKRRFVPYHMHISTELIEGVYVICAMLEEIPLMAAHPYDQKRRTPTRFRRLLDNHEKQPFQGPPENSRETLMVAAKALQRGRWRECTQLLFSLKLWKIIDKSAEVMEKLTERIKKEALRTYLFTYSTLYESFSTKQLASMFEVSGSTVHATVSRMMVREELAASWDESSEFIIVNYRDPTPGWGLPLQVSEHLVQGIEHIEGLTGHKVKYSMQKDMRSATGTRNSSALEDTRGSSPPIRSTRRTQRTAPRGRA